MNNENKYLGEEKISKLLLKFSIPCILSLLVSALYNIVDQIFIGHSELGYLGNAATGIVFPLLVIALAFSWMFSDGTAAYLSICQGRHDTENAHKSVGISFTMNLIVSIILMLVFAIFDEQLLTLFGASEATLDMALTYFHIMVITLPIYMFINDTASIIRADGSPAFAMISSVAGAITNIILDPIFIFVFKMGIAGAAWATVIGEVVTAILCIVYFAKYTKTFKLAMHSFALDGTLLSRSLSLGVSTFITQMSIVFLALTCNVNLAKYGAMSIYGADIPISVISIETKVFTIVINIVVGLILGAQPIIGYNFGAKNIKRVKETFFVVLRSTIMIGLIATAIFEFWPELIIGIFGNGDALYMDFACQLFRIFLSLITCTITIKMMSIFLQAVGEPKKAAIVSLSRDIICFIPLCIFLPTLFAPEKGIYGVLLAAPIADIIAIIVTVIIGVNYFRKLDHIMNTESEPNLPESAAIIPSKKGIIITIEREHGSLGKQIGKEVSKALNIPFYYREMAVLAAQKSGLDKDFLAAINTNTPDALANFYLSTSASSQAIVASDNIIKDIAEAGSCVIVGRAASQVLAERDDVVRIFITAPKEYRIQKIMEMYGDNKEDALRYMKHVDESRAAYYKMVSNKTMGMANNYQLVIDSSIGVEQSTKLICEYIAAKLA